MATKQPIVQLQDLTYAIGDHLVLDRVTLDIYEGEIFSVLGLSGTGKTTLLRLIFGLIEPIDGTIVVLGHDITQMSEEEMNALREKMGLVFQYGALFDSMNVRANVGFRLYEQTNLPEDEIRKVVTDKLHLVGLPGTDELFPAELSGGMQKRVGIARALVGDPQILLYDEPTSGLDPVIAANIDELIGSLRDKLGVTEIVVSHDVVNALRQSDRLGFLYRGELRLVGTADEFRASTDPVVRQFLEGSTQGPIQVV
ncbi:MAG: ABC transporter ATP-binding protein [Armatimonadota bacterium]